MLSKIQVLAALGLTSQLQVRGQAPLAEAIKAKEDALSTLTNSAQNVFYNRCEDQKKCGRSYTGSDGRPCTVPACGSDFPTTRGFDCTDQWGSAAGTCGSVTPLARSLSSSVVRFSENTDFTSIETEAFVCSTTR